MDWRQDLFELETILILIFNLNQNWLGILFYVVHMLVFSMFTHVFVCFFMCIGLLV